MISSFVSIPPFLLPARQAVNLSACPLTRRGSHLVSPDHPVFVIDGDMILVAKAGFLVLPGPAGLGVLLRLHGRIGCKTFRGLTRLDLCIFLPAVALPGHFHKNCINDLTLMGAIALRD